VCSSDLPQRIYEAPANLFVATFIGSPPMNLLRGRLEGRDGAAVCMVGDQRLPLPAAPAIAAYDGSDVGVGIRPEHLEDPALGGDGAGGGRLRGRVLATELLGSDLLVHLEIDAPPVVTEELIEVAADIDAATVEELRAEAERNRTTVICRFDPRSRAHVDEAIEVGLPADRLHFFDLETGLAIRR